MQAISSNLKIIKNKYKLFTDMKQILGYNFLLLFKLRKLINEFYSFIINKYM